MKHFENAANIISASAKLDALASPDTEKRVKQLGDGVPPNVALKGATAAQLEVIAEFDEVVGDPDNTDEHKVADYAREQLKALAA